MENNSYNVLESTSSYFSNDIYIRYIYDKKFKIVEIRFSKIKSLYAFTFSYLSTIYLIITNLIFHKKLDYYKFSAVARVKREQEKIERVYEGVQIITDDIVNHDYSLFKLNKRIDRIYFMIFMLLPKMIIEYIKLIKIFKSQSFKKYKYDALIYFTKRIGHSSFFQFTLNRFLNKYDLNEFCTGAFSERFGLIIQNLSYKYQKKLICIPHGNEGSIYLPKGYVGDIFFCTNYFDAVELNSLYKTKKFIYDDNIVKKMFELNPKSEKREKANKVVFFTQPSYGNEFSELFLKLKEYDYIKFFVKVHPLDFYNQYTISRDKIINNLRDSLSNSICISVNSTSLIEALYNNSKSISLVHIFHNEEEASKIINDTKFLLDENILKPKSFEEFFHLLELLN